MQAPYFLFGHDSRLKAHPDYVSAKSGGREAALNLVQDLAFDFLLEKRFSLPEEVVFVAPFARELAGDNAIPQVLATACAWIAGGKVDEEIVQVTRVFHTGADPMERLCLRAQFDGAVVQGQAYFLVDDVVNMGGTLAELSNHIQINGGRVAGAMTMVNAGRLKFFSPEAKSTKILKERFGDEITHIFGIEIDALTANEARYLVGFRTLDEVRNRLAKARKEIHNRLRSKGICWSS